jgi:hypothetical protein
MTDSDVRTVFANVDMASEPPLPAGYLDQTLARARRAVRRRRLAGLGAGTVAVVLLVVAVALLPFPTLPRSQVGRPDGPSLPDRFAPYSPLTASVRTSPPGRAIALYEYGSSELFTSWQLLVAGADRDTYRRVEFDPMAPRLLAPDGSRVLFYAEPRTFHLVDLTSGTTTTLASVEWASNVGAGLQLLAWSPDGRYVAYAVPAPSPGDGRAENSFLGERPIMDLALLDLTSGATTRVAGFQPVWAAAFAPDGRTLAVQTGPGKAWITTVDGHRVRSLDLIGGDLAHGIAWSPDGALLATAPYGGGTNEAPGDGVTFIDASGTGAATPRALPAGRMLGWSSPTSVIVHEVDDATGDVVAEVSTRDGSARVLSSFDRASRCEFWQMRCRPYRIQLASALLPHAGLRPGDPDRGPLPLWLRVLVAAAVLPATAAVVWWATRARRRGQRSISRWRWSG